MWPAPAGQPPTRHPRTVRALNVDPDKPRVVTPTPGRWLWPGATDASEGTVARECPNSRFWFPGGLCSAKRKPPTTNWAKASRRLLGHAQSPAISLLATVWGAPQEEPETSTSGGA
ncbi:unnamed protein product [Lampetra planeri]